jgi:30S ribosomal protein S31
LELAEEILIFLWSYVMGKGDQKTRRGKIVRGSYGKTRPHHPKTSEQATAAAKKPKAVKK